MRILKAIEQRIAAGDKPAGVYSGPHVMRAPDGTTGPRVVILPLSSAPEYDSMTRRWEERFQVSVYGYPSLEDAIAIRNGWEAWIELGNWAPYGLLRVDAAPEVRREMIDDDREGYHVFVDMVVTHEETRQRS